MNTMAKGELQVRPAVTRMGLCSRVKQLVILMFDCSPSMEGEKARHAYAAMCDFIATLAQPMNKDGFIVLIIYFNGKAWVACPWTSATALDGKIPPFNIASATNMREAVELAIRELGTYQKLDGVMYLLTVGFLLTDGHYNEGGTPLAATTKFKTNADLVTVAFGDDADEGLLEEMATSPQHFYRVQNGAELRNFMAVAGPTLTISMAQKKNATIGLGQMNRD